MPTGVPAAALRFAPRVARVVRVVRVAIIVACTVGVSVALAQPDGPPAPQPVPYTVQVAALSDAEAAIDLSTALLREGFPAYVVRAAGAAGAVYRIRVGAFGDRASADQYARTMGERSGGAARPALAEAIPSGILPLAPVRIAALPWDQAAQVVPWGEGRVAVRTALDDQPYRYLPEGSDVTAAFHAWWAAPLPNGGRVEVAVAPLDDPDFGAQEGGLREALFRQRLRFVAEGAELDEQVLMESAVRGDAGERHLLVHRSVGSGAGRILGVALRDADPADRDPDAWLGERPPEPAAPLLEVPVGEPDEMPTRATGSIGDMEWTAEADGPWLAVSWEGARWRAAVGEPLGGTADVLLVRHDGERSLLRLLPR